MRRFVCLLIAFMLLFALVPSASRAEGNGEESGVYDPFAPENQDDGAPPEERHTYDPQPKYAPFSYGPSPDPRYVNVLLSQADHMTATVTFTGNYALCDASDTPVFRVESDYAYIVAVNGTSLELRSADGALLYSAAGFYFKEYAPPAGLSYNYFKVAKVSNVSPASDRIYKGELNCYYQTNSGLYAGSRLWTGIYLVNRVYIEEYLKGVLPAEIGSGKPAAAQRAQAIVARNFAVKSKRTDGRVFDVHDYNASQVYFGIYVFDDTSAAVDATAGQVLTWGGSAIRAYYCNTNGGYTEVSNNEWTGEGQSGPESVRYDEYDLKATSYIESVTIPAVPTGGETAVLSLIANALIPKLTELGYSGLSAANVTVAGISIANGACYDAACRHHDGADPAQICTHFCSVDVTFTGIVAGGTAIVGPVAVNLKDIDFFIAPANGRPLGFFTRGELSHYWLVPNYNAANPALVDSYTIRHARHGSGVGLSQQGAIERAKAGHTYTQILDFYFPGCAVAPHASLAAPDTLGDISAVAFQKTYDVLGHDAYVYARSNANSVILGILKADACVLIQNTSETWVKIAYESGSGYILKSALERTFTKAAVTNIVSSLPIRSAPNADAGQIGTAVPGNVFALIEWNADAAYHKINFNGQTGYISARYAKLLTAAAAGDEAGLTAYAVSVNIPSGYADTMLWVDGVAYQGTVSGGVLTASVYTNAATNAVMYLYNEAGTPRGMSVWLLSFANNAYAATKVEDFTDLLSYHGFSARITGQSGIRFKSGIAESTRNALVSTGIAGYKLVEYGTVSFHYPQHYGAYPFVICQNDELPTGYGKSYWTEGGTTYDYIVETVDGRIRFASVRVGIDDDNLDTEFIFRSYIQLTNGSRTIILYGAPMTRSIYTIARYYMDRGDYTDDSPEGIFLNRIIDYVESNR